MFSVIAERAVCGLINSHQSPAVWGKHFARTLTSMKYFQQKAKKPAPFDYVNKLFTPVHSVFDHTKMHYDENTKLIVIEGPIAAGKKQLGREIAAEFGMHFMEPRTADDVYINMYGFDKRDRNNLLPEPVQWWDDKCFHRRPFHENTICFLLEKFGDKYVQYLEHVMSHIFNTGQGVVTVRSPFSDFVFAEAMFHSGFISPNARNLYYKVIGHSLYMCWRPHVVIYLDVPVDKTLENIKNRGIDYEVNSKAISPHFLAEMEKPYKERFLIDASMPSEVLVYDWSEGGDSEVVIEDLERINDFDIERHREDPKYIDWRQDEWHHDKFRVEISYEKIRQVCNMGLQNYSVPEAYASGNNWESWERIMEAAPGEEYDEGYNKLYGERVFWKKEYRHKDTYYI